MISLRLTILRWLTLAVLGIFALALFKLQVINGAKWRTVSEHNFTRWVREPAARGRILDTKGRPLATGVPTHTAWLISGEVPRKELPRLLQRLVELGIFPDIASATARIDECRSFPAYLPVRLKSDLTMAEVTRLEEELPYLPGVYLKDEQVRFYPDGALASHVIGYMKEINEEELREKSDEGYRLGDRLGRDGLERTFETELRGTDGGSQVEVDANGRILEVPVTQAPREGQTVTLTLDLDIQREAELALKGHRGAIVALDPNSGDILALADSPGYDLNRFSQRMAPREFEALKKADALRERALQGLYPPGSVFKIVTAAAALEAGKVTPGEFFYCEGQYKGIHCWKRAGHGALNLTSAIAESCNVAFMKMAERAGISSLDSMAARFGFGRETGIGVLTEMQGNVPDPERDAKLKSQWQLGDTLQVGIGQSSVLVTPLQCARLIAAIANDGRLVQPRLVRQIGSRTISAPAPTAINLKPDTILAIKRGLRAVVSMGTAHLLDPSLGIAGKTGTAQNPHGQDHAWFVGYAPAGAPTIALAVLIENGGHGGAVAAPIAQRVIRVALKGPSNH